MGNVWTNDGGYAGVQTMTLSSSLSFHTPTEQQKWKIQRECLESDLITNYRFGCPRSALIGIPLWLIPRDQDFGSNIDKAIKHIEHGDSGSDGKKNAEPHTVEASL